MADIKTRDAVKGTIKTIDKAAIASERMKSAYVGIKEKAEQGYYADENSATEYAADRISYAADRVKDEGIFKRFYRSKNTSESQGIGLGLPLAKAIVEGQGGILSVQSELLQGTTFTLSFLTES